MPRADAVSTPDDEPEFELVTSARQLTSAPPLRTETVTIDEWRTASGKAARFMLWELTAADYADFLESGRIYDGDGQFKRYDQKGEDIRYLAWTARDPNNNRLWPKIADAAAVLGTLGKATLNVLLNAANRCNAPKDAATAKNSEETVSGS